MGVKLRKTVAGMCILASVIMLDGAVLTSEDTLGLNIQTKYVAHAFDEARFQAELTRILQSDEMVTTALRNFDLPPSHYDVYHDHMTKLWGNDAVVGTFMEEMIAILPALNLENSAQAREFGMNYSAAWFQEMAMKGLMRLNSNKIRTHLKVAQGLFENSPPELCRAAVFDELTAPQSIRLEVGYLVTRPPSEVRSYLGTLREALLAEINDYPTVKTVGPSQRQILDQVFGQRLADALDAHPNGDELWVGLDDLNAVSDQALCDLTAITMQIAADEPGEVGDWMVRYMLQ
ncbi:hypothetical protein [uncultured Halomonas sp.]|uniref:hypothetical protein n=1 Tax=uncultured Halomonas sp. TaxID=173971 RepID=UPI00262D4E10|nr:hypothetical protein [uncultured Halomonas sp.]